MDPQPASEEKTAAQLARERRQQKLKNGGANRLARITKTFHPELYTAEQQRDASSPSSPAVKPAVATTGVTTSNITSDSFSSEILSDSDSLSAKDASTTATAQTSAATSADRSSSFFESSSDRSKSSTPLASSGDLLEDDPPVSDLSEFDMARHTKGSANTMASDDMSQFADDPLFKLLQEMKSDGSGSFDPFSAMINGGFGAFGSAMDGGPPNMGQSVPSNNGSTINHSDLIWKIAHILLCIFVAISGKGLLWKFCTGQVLLHSSRFIADKGQIRNTFIAQIAQYVGEPYRTYIRMSARYLGVFGFIYKDIGLLLFVYILVHGVRS